MPKKKPESMEERLRILGARLDDIVEHAQKTKDYAAKINLEEVRRQKYEIEKKLKDLRGPAKAAWQEVEKGLNTAWKDVRTALDKARKKFDK